MISTICIFFKLCQSHAVIALSNANMMAGEKKEKDPCWKNYEQVGMKNKDGKKVTNCVPKKSEGKAKAGK